VNAIRILCLGDSFTFGSGAEPGYSYPEQLEVLLNKNNPNLKFEVYNKGGCLPGLNSSQVLKMLDKDMAEYKPKIIIVLIGTHNEWNLVNSNYFLFTTKGWRNYFYRFDSLLTRLRIYKLLKITIGNLKYSFLKRKHSQKMINKVRLDPEVATHFKLANRHSCVTGRTDLAIEEYKRVIELDPKNDVAYAALGRIYENKHDYEVAQREFKKALEINPYNFFARDRLWNIYFKQGKNRLAIEEIKKILEIQPQNESLKKILRFGLPSLEEFKNEELHIQLLRYDLESIIKLAKIKGVTPILLSYPRTDKYDEMRRELSKKYKIPFIDIYSVFKKIKTSESYRHADYFSKDGHCNANGYRIIAEEIYKTLKLLDFRYI
jgi:tetratricopeptide (TPR) repeat protein